MALFLDAVGIQNVNIHIHYKTLKVRVFQRLSKSAKNTKHNKIKHF